MSGGSHEAAPGLAGQMSGTKQILILAGPNGAGKTTFAQEFLVGDADCPTFVNADLIAEELSPKEPARATMRAGRLMVGRIRAAAAGGESFAFETTLADREKFRKRVQRHR
jgi:predicted ABC-type ATPase